MTDREIKRELDKWLNENYQYLQDEIDANICTSRAMKEFSGDLLAHMVEALYKTNRENKINLIQNDKIGHWMLRGAAMQLKSRTSPFYIKYRRHKISAREEGLPDSNSNIFEREYEPYDGELYECFLSAFDDLHWYQKKIMTLYWLEGKSLREIHKYYNISKQHLVKDINTAINEIRQACKHC